MIMEKTIMPALHAEFTRAGLVAAPSSSKEGQRLIAVCAGREDALQIMMWSISLVGTGHIMQV